MIEGIRPMLGGVWMADEEELDKGVVNSSEEALVVVVNQLDRGRALS